MEPTYSQGVLIDSGQVRGACLHPAQIPCQTVVLHSPRLPFTLQTCSLPLQNRVKPLRRRPHSVQGPAGDWAWRRRRRGRGGGRRPRRRCQISPLSKPAVVLARSLARLSDVMWPQRASAADPRPRRRGRGRRGGGRGLQMVSVDTRSL